MLILLFRQPRLNQISTHFSSECDLNLVEFLQSYILKGYKLIFSRHNPKSTFGYANIEKDKKKPKDEKLNKKNKVKK